MTPQFDQSALTVLKVDLQINSQALDDYLVQLIQAAEEYIGTEGIVLAETPGDTQLVVMYAAYLYRRRREENTAMPRMLRYALNNRVLKQSVQSVGDTTDG